MEDTEARGQGHQLSAGDHRSVVVKHSHPLQVVAGSSPGGSPFYFPLILENEGLPDRFPSKQRAGSIAERPRK